MAQFPLRSSLRASLWMAAAMLYAALLGACSGGKKAQNVAAAAAPAGLCPVRPNALLVTRDQSLVTRDMKTGKECKLLTAPANQFVTYPTWSPDGKRFVYMLDTPFQGNTGADWGTDIYAADASGANQALLVKHDQPGVQLESPSWTPDGKTLIYSYIHTQYDAQGQYKGQTYEARRLDLGTGQATQFLNDATSSSLCTDGSRLTYVDFNEDDFNSFGIWVADGAGQNGQAIVLTDTGIQAFYAPEFSPDCKRIIFAGVGGSLRNLPGGPSTNPIARVLNAFRPAVAEAHGPPWDLWSVNADGTDLKRLTHLNEDMPYPAWSSGGQSVVFLGTSGLFEMAPDGSGLKKLDQGTVHGQLSWRDK